MSALPASETLLSKVIARVAHEHGIVLTPADPLITAVYLNKAILEQYLALAVAPIKEAIAEATTRAQQDIREHAREQAAYIDQIMLKDRAKFVTEQQAALDALDERLVNRDAALVKLMADILQKAQAQMAAERAHRQEKGWIRWLKKKKDRAGFGPLETGIVIGIVTMVGGTLLIVALLRGL